MHTLTKFSFCKTSLVSLWLLLSPELVIANQSQTGVSQAVQAATMQLELAYRSTGSRNKISVKSPDSRLRLATCSHLPTSASIAEPLKFGKVTLKVNCTHPQQWSIYLSAVIMQPVTLWNSSQNIQRNAIISRSDIHPSESWLARVPTGAIQSPEQIVGMQARQSIQPNQLIKERLLRLPLIIQKGHRLNAQVLQPGFSITTQVVALQDGARGDTIKVENSKTGKLLFARINAKGQLMID